MDYNISEDILTLADKYKDQPDGVKILRALQECLNKVSPNRRMHNKEISDIIREAKGFNVQSPVTNDKPQLKTITFGADAFNPPKPQTQPVPVADSEIKAQKEDNTGVAEVFRIHGLGIQGCEAEFKDFKNWLIKVKELGFVSKKSHKDFESTWPDFVEFFHQTMGI